MLSPQGQPINKTVFVAFYQGENLKSRLKKVCTGYHATLYTCPSSVSERDGVVRELRIRLEDLNVVSTLETQVCECCTLAGV